jgi:ABC-type sugar transport system substrate-binding protein
MIRSRPDQSRSRGSSARRIAVGVVALLALLVAVTAASAMTNGAQKSAAAPPKGTCVVAGCNVYGTIDWSGYKGQRVGVLNLAPVPGATRWSTPLSACLKAHGANVNYVDVGGDITKAGPTIQGWLASDTKAIFDIGIPIDGQRALIDQAAAKHIPIILWGAGNPAGTIALDANQAVDGVLIAEYLVNKLGDSFSVTIISASTNPALLARVAGAKAVFGLYPNIKMSYREVPQYSVLAAQQVASALLQANPKLSAIVGAYGDYGMGAANAVQRVKGKTIVVSMNGDPQEYDAIRTGGPLKATVADGHEAGGRLACETGAVMLSGGKATGKHVFLSSAFVDANNLPAAGQVDESPRTLDRLGS